MSMIEERKAAYENSSLKKLMEASGHEVCPRCYCCDLVPESAMCWKCGGSDPDDPEQGICDECEGEGQVFSKECLGRCDENGEHKRQGTAI